MKFFFVLLLIAAVFLGRTIGATEREIFQDLTETYRAEMLNFGYGQFSISVDEDDGEVGAEAMVFGQERATADIIINRGTLEMTTDDEILVVACHEIGHYLGVRFTPGFALRNLTVEGEADYFSGQCMVRYLMEKRGFGTERAIDEALSLAKRTFSMAHASRLESRKAYAESAMGITEAYPSPECRLLSVEHGARGWLRPACWFNP